MPHQVPNLLKDLQDEFGLSYVFINHDLAVARFIGDEVLVMKDGVVVEQASAAQILANPCEDHTKRPGMLARVSGRRLFTLSAGRYDSASQLQRTS